MDEYTEAVVLSGVYGTTLLKRFWLGLRPWVTEALSVHKRESCSEDQPAIKNCTNVFLCKTLQEGSMRASHWIVHHVALRCCNTETILKKFHILSASWERQIQIKIFLSDSDLDTGDK